MMRDTGTGKCVGTAIGQHCDPNAHAPQMHQLQNSDAMDIDRGGRRPPLKCYSCGKLGHTVKFCRNKRQICGGNGFR